MESRLSMAVIALVIAGACGGKAGPTENDVIPPPPPPPTHVASGVVYARSDTIAYLPDATSLPLLGNVAITVPGASGSTSTSGAFFLSTTTQPVRDFLQVNASHAGFQPGWIPFLTAEVGKPINIGLYPEVPVIPRPGFVRGYVGFDAGGAIPAIFSMGHDAPTIARARDMGANLFAYADFQRMSSLDVAAGTATLGAPPWGGTTRAMYQSMVGHAKSKGMQYLLMAGISPGPNVDFGVLFSLPVNDPIWNPIFDQYRSFVEERATWARDLGIEYLLLGGGVSGFLTRHPLERWAPVLSAIRGTGYTGKIGFVFGVATNRGFFEYEQAAPGFMELFDYALVSVGQGIWPTTDGEKLVKAFSRARMRADMQRLLAHLSSIPVPVFLQLGTPSVHGAINTEEFLEACVICVPNPIITLRTRDYYQQADLYQATAEAINGSPTGNGRVMGLLSWQYIWFDDLTGGGAGAYDKGANVRGKPAEAVLKWWFERW